MNKYFVKLDIAIIILAVITGLLFAYLFSCTAHVVCANYKGCSQPTPTFIAPIPPTEILIPSITPVLSLQPTILLPIPTNIVATPTWQIGTAASADNNQQSAGASANNSPVVPTSAPATGRAE